MNNILQNDQADLLDIQKRYANEQIDLMNTNIQFHEQLLSEAIKQNSLLIGIALIVIMIVVVYLLV